MNKIKNLYVDLFENPMGRITRLDLFIVLFTTTFLMLVNELFFWEYPVNSLIFLLLNISWIIFCINRYHDSGHKGWWILVPIANLIFLFYNSTEDNKWGPKLN